MNDTNNAETNIENTPRTASRGRGKIARLPKPTRDQINNWLLDGLPYQEIIQRLGPAGADLKTDNLYQWSRHGYQEWLVERRFIDALRARQETPADMVRDYDATTVTHAALQLGTLQIFEALRDLGPRSLDEKLGGNAAAFARLLSALSRASREAMLLQKYRAACAAAQAAMLPLKDPKRKLSEPERHAIVHHVDQILGLEEVPPPPSDELAEALGVLTLKQQS